MDKGIKWKIEQISGWIASFTESEYVLLNYVLLYDTLIYDVLIGKLVSNSAGRR
ncbi:MAG: hypothetical protein GKR95_04625 [Gammaproteobacteria bacterium]|nr:hypothetical protein [Gammaproteobacteria bacterium]